ncbi:hypothetical protein DL93DRAFT_2093149 [Clavulina sp. PMI_390]|nr:hypothetical protein DL93DRAFT_2093149 [Clavulina sp. PMI_390]
MSTPHQQQFRPLAGRPPFATDEPDEIYNLPAQPRPPRQKPENPNARSSAYNTYDDYLDEGNDGSNRDSGAAFGVGMGLLGEVSDSDDDDDDDIPSPAATAAKGKNQALFEALNGGKPEPAAPAAPKPLAAVKPPSSAPNAHAPSSAAQPKPPPPAQQQRRDDQPQRPPQLAIPAPAAAMNAQPARSPQFPPSPSQLHQQQMPPSPHIAPQPAPSMPREVPPRIANGSPMPAPRPQRPAPAFMMAPPPSSPAPNYPGTPAPQYPGGPMTPTLPAAPLQLPPSTPITPLFAAPPKAFDSEKKSDPKVAFNVIRAENDVFVEKSRKGSMSTEESFSSEGSHAQLRPRQRPKGDGDDFWRRFSMVAHQAEVDKRKNSSRSAWLAKTESRTKSYSRWVALSGFFLLCLIAGGIAIGIYLNIGKGNGHATPVAIGGSQNESNVAASKSSTSSSAAATTKTGLNAQKVITSNGSVVAAPTKRAIEEREPMATEAPAVARHEPVGRRRHRNRMVV